MAGQIEVALERIAQLKEEIGGLTSEPVSAAEQSELASKELAVIEDMFARGYVNRLICKSLTLLFDRHGTLVTRTWIWRVTLLMCAMFSPGGRLPVATPLRLGVCRLQACRLRSNQTLNGALVARLDGIPEYMAPVRDHRLAARDYRPDRGFPGDEYPFVQPLIVAHCGEIHMGPIERNNVGRTAYL